MGYTDLDDHSGIAETELGLALRALQKLDEVSRLSPWRHLLVEAETRLGDLLGLTCTGEPGIWNDAGEVVGYDHDGCTCPVHEWLVEADQPAIMVAATKQAHIPPPQ